MAVIAVAGGTGNVGRTIVEAILATGKHEVKILARKPNPEAEAELGVPIIVVDYANHEALIKTLEANAIHTVISTISMMPTSGQPFEPELIRAADASKTTRRMISSDWGVPVKPEYSESLPSVGTRLTARAALEATTDLEHTVFHTGFFLDYWGAESSITSHMPPLVMVVDLAHGAASIPGSGDVPVVFTHTRDIARFVVASLDLEAGTWDPVTTVVGDRLTWNEFVALVEEVRGIKMNVTYDSVEKLKSGQVTELPNQIASYQFIPKEYLQGSLAAFGLWFEAGAFDLKPEKLFNDQFPEIVTTKVRDILKLA
ncbi:hypothetical protein BX600DRAFT_301799 [Xylariales sp. PMI_506]|nr:hypothetical protein BX600DRAFT_301799 [Xylariales sp. PMI_506]